MAELVVEAGQTVEYRGQLVEAHGRYRVVEVRPTWVVAPHGGEEVVPRLVLEPLQGGRRLRGVRLQSVVVVEEVSP